MEELIDRRPRHASTASRRTPASASPLATRSRSTASRCACASLPPPPRVIAYHKPVGEVVTHGRPGEPPDGVPPPAHAAAGKWQSVGRLDINTEGLLLFTNSGELANQLMHPRFGVEREYAVRVLGSAGRRRQRELLARAWTSKARSASFKFDRRRRRRRREPLVPRGHHRRPQPRGAQAVRRGGPGRQPADPHPLRLRGAAARPEARRVGRPERVRCAGTCAGWPAAVPSRGPTTTVANNNGGRQRAATTSSNDRDKRNNKNNQATTVARADGPPPGWQGPPRCPQNRIAVSVRPDRFRDRRDRRRAGRPPGTA